MGKMSYLVPMGAVASEIPAGLLSGWWGSWGSRHEGCLPGSVGSF